MTVQLPSEAERRRRSLAIQALNDTWLTGQVVDGLGDEGPSVGPGDYGQHLLVMESAANGEDQFWNGLEAVLAGT